jgi:hypothetical protein
MDSTKPEMPAAPGVGSSTSPGGPGQTQAFRRADHARGRDLLGHSRPRPRRLAHDRSGPRLACLRAQARDLRQDNLRPAIAPAGADEVRHLHHLNVREPPSESRHRESSRSLGSTRGLRPSQDDRNHGVCVLSLDDRITGQRGKHTFISTPVWPMTCGTTIEVHQGSLLARVAPSERLLRARVVGIGPVTSIDVHRRRESLRREALRREALRREASRREASSDCESESSVWPL